MRLRLVVSAVLLGAFLSPLVARAQIMQIDDTTSTPTPGVGHDYIQALNETVDPSVGSVSLDIQVPTPKGRGLTLPFSFSYNSNGVNYLVPIPNGYSTYQWFSNNSFLSQGGWAYAAPAIGSNYNSYQDTYGDQCIWQSNFMLQDPSGGRVSFPGMSVLLEDDTDEGTELQLCQEIGIYASPGATNNYVAESGNPEGSNFTPIEIANANATVFSYPNITLGHEAGYQVYSQLPTSVEDHNGNIINISDLNNGAFTYTDTLGRMLLSSSGFGPSENSLSNTITVSGTSNPYTVTWTSGAFDYNPGYTLAGYNWGSCSGVVSSVQGTQEEIQSITLPNGEGYEFQYDPTYGV